jgi:tubulin alpha
LERLSVEYGKKCTIGLIGFPSPHYYNDVCEAYNTVLSLESLITQYGSTILYDNEALFSICNDKLNI